VIYELHVGAFTQQGTLAAAARVLAALADLGVTAIEVMPIADFAGRFGWEYDGVNLSAPTRLYGEPDDLRRLVDSAHHLGLGVILDVVYDHLWGQAVNFDGSDAGPVREFFATNAGYRIDEFHLDGLRLDATQQMFDSSSEHILSVITRRVREAARGRATFVVAENERQQAKLARAGSTGGYGLDALWKDDFHHAARVATTGNRAAYYSDYLGHPQELVSAVKCGYLYQGQPSSWQKAPRGTASRDLAPRVFVNYLQNHDQVANSGRGDRVHRLTSPGRLKAMTAVLLLTPATPLLFMGQEFAATAPFLYFADHRDELAAAVREGQLEYLRQFPSLATVEMRHHIPDPTSTARCGRPREIYPTRPPRV
jgi:maltooligosyltrehalose trehalohydrolase